MPPCGRNNRRSPRISFPDRNRSHTAPLRHGDRHYNHPFLRTSLCRRLRTSRAAHRSSCPTGIVRTSETQPTEANLWTGAESAIRNFGISKPINEVRRPNGPIIATLSLLFRPRHPAGLSATAGFRPSHAARRKNGFGKPATIHSSATVFRTRFRRTVRHVISCHSSSAYAISQPASSAI